MSLNHFLINLVYKGFDLSVIYDIGACKGKWSQGLCNTLPRSKFILFEANSSYIPDLQRTGFEFYQTVLSSPNKKQVQFYNGTDTGDSYYKENTKWYESKSSIVVDCKTLDQMVKTHNLPLPNFIKLDTQGSELDILSGASFLDSVDLVYTECPIICYNKGAPNIQEYLDFFKKRDFIPIEIFEIHKLEDTLLQIDIMFMKKSAKEKFLQPNVNINPFI
jgi:FkbM family methyltransferase